MKTIIITLFYSLLMLSRSFAQNAICTYESNNASLANVTFSENGFGHTPKGNLHMLLLFVTFTEDDIVAGTDGRFDMHYTY